MSAKHISVRLVCRAPLHIRTMEATVTDLRSEVTRLRNHLAMIENKDGSDEQITISDYLLARLEQLGVTV